MDTNPQKQILSSTGNQISGIAVWAQKARYPDVSAGPIDETSLGQLTAADVSLNGNWFRFRNFVNDLRARIDAGLAAIQDASETVPGKINLTLQLLTGVKQFVDGAWLGKNNVKTGQLKFFKGNNPSVTVVEPTHTQNRLIYLPDQDCTLASIGDVNAASGNLDTHKGSGDHDSRYYIKTAMDTKLAALAGGGLVKNTDGTYSPVVDGSTVSIVAGKLTTVVKESFTLVFSYADGKVMYGNTAITSACAPALGKAGTITQLVVTSTSGAVTHNTGSNVGPFQAFQRIGIDEDAGVIMATVNGVSTGVGAGCETEIAFITVHGYYN